MTKIKLIDRSTSRYILRTVARCAVPDCAQSLTVDGEGVTDALPRLRVFRALEARGWSSVGGVAWLCPAHRTWLAEQGLADSVVIHTGTGEVNQITIQEAPHGVRQP